MSKAYANRYRSLIVCIDSYDTGIMSGKIYNPFIEGSIEFYGVMSFINGVESILNAMVFPGAMEKKRRFKNTSSVANFIEKTDEVNNGRIATFELKVLYRQNASWQGSVKWLEDNKEENYRSALELLGLMDSVLAGAECHIMEKLAI